MRRFLYWLAFFPLQILLLTAFGLADGLRALALPFRRRRRPYETADGAAAGKERLCSIVMLNWNGRHLLEESLPALSTALDGTAHEVIVVDNGSQDDSVDWLKRSYPQVRVVALESNLGFGSGNNRGVEAAGNDIVVLLNNDMIVDRDFLPPLLEPFADDDVFAVSSQIFFPEGRRREETGNTQCRFRKGALEMLHAEITPAHERRRVLPVLWAGGGSSAFRRDRFLELGGFSSIYDPCYLEDADLSYRAARRGWRVLVAAHSKVLHKHRSSSSKRFDQEQLVTLVEERRLWYLWRNFPLRDIARHLLLFPIHLNLVLSVRGYAGSLRRLPRVLLLRMAEPRHVYGHRKLLRWREHPIDYLNHFFPDRGFKRGASPDLPAPAIRGQAERVSDTSFRSDSRGAPRERLRILVVSAYLPHLGYHGGGGRVFQLLRQVARQHDITLVTFVETLRELREAEQVNPFCRRMEVVRRGAFIPLSPFPYEPFEEFNCPTMRERLEKVLAEEDFDLVHFEWTQMALYADLLPRTRKLITEIEVNYAAHLTQLRVEGNPFKKLRQLYNSWQTLVREVQLCRQVDRIVCVTDDDCHYLRGHLPGRKLRVVNTGVDTDYFAFRGTVDIDPDLIVFVGAFRHSPNIDAMRFFCGRIFPDILKARPKAKLAIVGSSPPAEIRALGKHPNIEVTGFVEDIRDWYYAAQVVVVPLRTGVGIRGKVLEGWSAGRAMVATTLACQGIEAIHGENILIADSARDIARWTIALLDHPEYAERLGSAGRQTAERLYDWRPLGKRMCDVYEDLYTASGDTEPGARAEAARHDMPGALRQRGGNAHA